MYEPTEIQATEEQPLSGDQAAASADGLVVDNANGNAGQEEGFEIVLKDDENKPKQDPAKNAEFARRRLERKRQRELEQQMEAVKRGEVPENLRVNPELPPQPNANDYFSDEALEKYGWDTPAQFPCWPHGSNYCRKYSVLRHKWHERRPAGCQEPIS